VPLMKFLNIFIMIVDGINEWIGKILSWMIVVLVLLTVIEVIARYFFNSPTIWNFEVTTQLYGFYFIMLIGYTLKHNGHVSVEIISSTFRPRTRAAISVLCYLVLFFPFCAIFIWQGVLFASKSWGMMEHSQSAFSPPLYPIKTVLPIAAILLGLQGLGLFFKKLYFLIKGSEL